MTNKARVKRIFILLAGLFFITFVFRLAYEIYFSYNDVIISYYTDYGYSTSNSVYLEGIVSYRNVATEKVSQKDFAGREVFIDQKYEKTANVSSNTAAFQNDNQRLRQIIENNDAVIQTEYLSGLEGFQRLSMTVGVMPERFDDIVEDIRKIGDIRSFTVNKEDKTAEYMNLIAEQETLMKTRDSYLTIKEMGGGIPDLLIVEEKILEVERDLQRIGVNIGIYAADYSLCTVNFTLNETLKQTISVRFIFTCVKESLLWTVLAYILFLFVIFAGLAAAALFVKMNVFIKKKNDESP